MTHASRRTHYGASIIGELRAAQRATIRRGLYKLSRDQLDNAVMVETLV